jgi:hypothetical protein
VNTKVAAIDFSLVPKQLFSRKQRLNYEACNPLKSDLFKKAVIRDFFTEDFNDGKLIESKLNIIRNEFPEAKLETEFVPVFDEEGNKFSERKAFNLVIERP